jgi:hypothetical protein
MIELKSTNPRTPMRRIGTVELLETTVQRDSGYDCAAWWQDVELAPQSVELKANGYYVSWAFAGQVIDSYLGSLCCGVPVASYDKARDVGRNARAPHTPDTGTTLRERGWRERWTRNACFTWIRMSAWAPASTSTTARPVTSSSLLTSAPRESPELIRRAPATRSHGGHGSWLPPPTTPAAYVPVAPALALGSRSKAG